jgi:hypothetical protein
MTHCTLLVRFLPAWLPGAGFKRQAEIWRNRIYEFAAIPYQFVKKAMVSDWDSLPLLYICSSTKMYY